MAGLIKLFAFYQLLYLAYTMYVERIISFNKGWSILNSQKKDEWESVLLALGSLNTDRFIELGAKRAMENDHENGFFYFMYSMFLLLLTSVDSDWPSAEAFLTRKILSLISSTSLTGKNGVVASLLGFDEKTGGDFASNIFLKLPYCYNAGLFDVMVLLVPTQEAINYFIDKGVSPVQLQAIPTETNCREQLAKFGLHSILAPVVIAFYSANDPQALTLEEVPPIEVGIPSIERTLEFAPEYYQASVGLLSYFGEVLRQKDPNTKAKVRIEQDGNIVRLRIESSAGEIETIEKELEQYALVVSNQAPPESLLDNAGQIVQLKAQLRVAQVQVETAYDVRQLTDGRIADLSKQIALQQEQIEFLQAQFAAQVIQKGQVIHLAEQQVGSHERMQAALLGHAGMLFKDLLEESRGNYQLLTAIQNLHQNLLSGLTTIEVEEGIKHALAEVSKTKPTLLARIYSQVEGLALKAGTSASLTWAAEVIKHALPK